MCIRDRRQTEQTREERYFFSNSPQSNFEDELIFKLTVEDLIKEIPSDLKQSFKEYLLDDIPVRVLCRKNGVSRDRMRYWIKKLRPIIKKL